LIVVYKKTNPVYRLLQLLSNILDQILKDKKKFFGAFVLGLLMLFILLRFKGLLITAILIGIGSVSMIYVRFFRMAHYIGFELCTMATVLVSLSFGPAYGAFAGFASITGALILSGYFKPSYFISVLALPLVGLAAPYLSHLPLWQTGLIMTVAYDIIVLPVYVLLGSRIISSIIFFITHVLLNYWVFTTIAPLIFNIIN
jgi:hypothetical protein